MVPVPSSPPGATADPPRLGPFPIRRGPGPHRALIVAAVGWVAATAASAVALAVLAAATDLLDDGRSTADLPLWAVVLVQIPLWLTMGAAAWVASRIGGTGRLADDVGLRGAWVDVPVGLALGLATYVVSVTLLAAVYQATGVDIEELGESAESLADRATGWGVLFFVVMTVVAAPFFEELFYRGLVLGGMLRHLSPAGAVVASSLMFGAVHLQLLELPALVVIGAVTALATLVTGRLGTAMWTHAGFNLTAVVIALALG